MQRPLNLIVVLSALCGMVGLAHAQIGIARPIAPVVPVVPVMPAGVGTYARPLPLGPISTPGAAIRVNPAPIGTTPIFSPPVNTAPISTTLPRAIDTRPLTVNSTPVSRDTGFGSGGQTPQTPTPPARLEPSTVRTPPPGNYRPNSIVAPPPPDRPFTGVTKGGAGGGGDAPKAKPPQGPLAWMKDIPWWGWLLIILIVLGIYSAWNE